jgi:hypothetical protein
MRERPKLESNLNHHSLFMVPTTPVHAFLNNAKWSGAAGWLLFRYVVCSAAETASLSLSEEISALDPQLIQSMMLAPWP